MPRDKHVTLLGGKGVILLFIFLCTKGLNVFVPTDDMLVFIEVLVGGEGSVRDNMIELPNLLVLTGVRSVIVPVHPRLPKRFNMGTEHGAGTPKKILILWSIRPRTKYKVVQSAADLALQLAAGSSSSRVVAIAALLFAGGCLSLRRLLLQLTFTLGWIFVPFRIICICTYFTLVSEPVK